MTCQFLPFMEAFVQTRSSSMNYAGFLKEAITARERRKPLRAGPDNLSLSITIINEMRSLMFDSVRCRRGETTLQMQ